MRGRKPKPTALKRVQGNPGKRKLSDDEPMPDPALLKPPSHVKGPAREEWLRVSPLLAELRISTQLDRAILEKYCVMYGRVVNLDKQIAKTGDFIEDADGSLKPNPLTETSRKAWCEVQRAAAELGITPSSRSRVHVPPISSELEDNLVGW